MYAYPESILPAMRKVADMESRAADRDMRLATLAASDALGRALDYPADYSREGTMRAWMEAHTGAQWRITTIQLDNRSGGAWAPANRRVIKSTPSFVELGQTNEDASRRDYRGMKVIGALGNARASRNWDAAEYDALIVADDWHTIIYVAVDMLASETN